MIVNSDGTVTLTVKELEYAIRNGIAQDGIQGSKPWRPTQLVEELVKEMIKKKRVHSLGKKFPYM